MTALSIQEYIANMSMLLRHDGARYGVMVERQILSQIIPHLNGRPVELLPMLLKLVAFCLDGPDFISCEFEQPEQLEHLKNAVAEKKGLFPNAAQAVWQVYENSRR